MKSILFLSGRELQYPRNQVIFNSLSQVYKLVRPNGGDEAIRKGGLKQIIIRSIRQSLDVLFSRSTHRCELVYTGFYGQLLANLFFRFSKKPLILDFFVSTYETLVEDRKIFKEGTWLADLAYSLDTGALKAAELIFVDTNQQKARFSSQFNLPLAKFRTIYVGCDEKLFYPRSSSVVSGLILYYCGFLPLHGVATVLEAAILLKNRPDLKFLLVGDGPERRMIEAKVREMSVTNFKMQDFVPIEALPDLISTTDICLGGHFSSSRKAQNVIPGKIFQLMAMKKPIIAGNTNANRELLTNGENALLVEPGDAKALANSILTLYDDSCLKERLATNAFIQYQRVASNKVIADAVLGAFKDVFE